MRELTEEAKARARAFIAEAVAREDADLVFRHYAEVLFKYGMRRINNSRQSATEREAKDGEQS